PLLSLCTLFPQCPRCRCRLPSFPTRRSSDLERGRVRERLARDVVDDLRVDVLERAEDGHARTLGGTGHLPANTELALLPAFDLEDRKSTRLNSSHVKISYAVFCLKKKKKPTR